jgi:hypothetical protein
MHKNMIVHHFESALIINDPDIIAILIPPDLAPQAATLCSRIKSRSTGEGPKSFGYRGFRFWCSVNSVQQIENINGSLQVNL